MCWILIHHTLIAQALPRRRAAVVMMTSDFACFDERKNKEKIKKKLRKN
jgi:hypothetical protein